MREAVDGVMLSHFCYLYLILLFICRCIVSIICYSGTQSMWQSPVLAFHIMKLVIHCKLNNIICSLLSQVCFHIECAKEMQEEKRKSIVIGAKILMFLQSEGWNRVSSQEFTAALTAVLQSLQEHWRAEVGPAWAGRDESVVS